MKLKFSAIGAAMLALMAMSAQANPVLPSTGASSIVFVAMDGANGQTQPGVSLTLNLGYSMLDFLPAVTGWTQQAGSLTAPGTTVVWDFTNNTRTTNGVADSGEPGLAGVTVRLIAANGSTVLGTTTTDSSGNYLFSNLPAGTYIVEVDRTSSAITGYLSSTDIASSATPDNDVNNDDNGIAVAPAAVRSAPVTLSLLAEPVTDGDSDPNSNLSVDFGFVRALSLGNLVWADVNNNGLVDAGETGIGGVTVRLIAADGVTVLQTTTTNASGPACTFDAIRFDFNEYNLSSGVQSSLSQYADCIKKGSLRFTLEGHADERGTDEFNMVLSQKRAASTRKYLIDLGVAAGALDTVGYGENKPMSTASNEDAWAANRRVEFKKK
jgi:outer membrane protein OmpA-like peptidoglycan-associated protein